MFWGLFLVFIISFILIVAFFKFSCFAKKKYLETESRFYEMVTTHMCQSCREACEKPFNLFFRAFLAALFVTGVVAVVMGEYIVIAVAVVLVVAYFVALYIYSRKHNRK